MKRRNEKKENSNSTNPDVSKESKTPVNYSMLHKLLTLVVEQGLDKKTEHRTEEAKEPAFVNVTSSRMPKGEQAGLELLMDAMLFGSSNAIERQEARGQQNLCKSHTLPRISNTESEEELKKRYLQMNIKILNVEDDLFYKTELPLGWKIVPMDHSMWNRLIDDKNRERGKIFYKAACYDRSAFFSPSSRFNIRTCSSQYNDPQFKRCDNYETNQNNSMYWAQVLDGEEVIYETKHHHRSKDFWKKDCELPYEKREENQEFLECKHFLETHKIKDYKNELLYWDQEFKF